MRKWSRYIALVLCMMLSVAMFAACTPDEPQTNEPTTGGDSDVSLDGMTFYFRGGEAFIPKNPRDYTDEEKAQAEASPPDYTFTEEAVMNKVVETEEKLGCTIICLDATLTWGYNDMAEFATMVSSGELPSDILYGEIRWGRELTSIGYMADLNEVDAIDTTDAEKWGSSDKFISTTYNDVLFGFPCIGSNYYPFSKRYSGIMLVKDDVYSSFNQDTTPRELDENNQWTFDTFEALLPNVTRTDENNRVYGITASGATFISCAVLSNGGDRVIYDDAQGKYVFGWSQPEAVSAIEWARSIIHDPAEVYNDGNDYEMFINGGATFLITDGYRWADEISSEGENYSWVPFPYGPDVEYGSTVAAFQDTARESFVGIMMQDDPERVQQIGIVMDELLGPVTYENYETYNDYLYRNYFNEGDEYSFNVYKTGADGYSFSYQFEMGSAYNRFETVCREMVTRNNATENLLGAVETIINQQLDINMNSSAE